MGFKFVLFRLFQNLVSVFKPYHDIKPFDGRDRWIVSAAMRIEGPFFVDGRVYDDFVIVSPRHWDYSAHQQYAGFAQAFRAGRVRTTNPKWDKGLKTPLFEQGFVDEHCRFYNRTEAHDVIKENGQREYLRGDLDFDAYDELFSEHLY